MNRNWTSVSTASLALSAVFAAWVLLTPAAQAAGPQSADVGASSSSKATKSGSGQVKVPATNVTVSETATTTTAIRGKPGTGAAAAGQARATTAQRDAEFKAILERAKNIGVRLTSADPRIVRQAQADQKRLRADLRSWAKKYHVRLKTRRIRLGATSTTGTPSGATLDPEEARQIYIGRPPKQGKVQDCDSELIIEGDRCTYVSKDVAPDGTVYCLYDCPDMSESPKGDKARPKR